eukprot:XP_011680368.1 PREDICTED: uncharacterized protein LOC105445918 [Strongylocentrotus purpuratus]
MLKHLQYRWAERKHKLLLNGVTCLITGQSMLSSPIVEEGAACILWCTIHSSRNKKYHAANQQSMEQASTSTRSPSVFSLDDCSDLSCVTGSEWSPRQSPSQPSLDTLLYDSPESKSPDQHPPLKRVKKVHFVSLCI